MVYQVAWTYTEDNAASEEILQDVFVLVWKNRAKLPEIKDFAAWAYVIAKNRSLRVLEQIAASPSPVELSADERLWQEDHTQQISEQQLQSLLREALTVLSPQQRKVFEMSRLEGLSRKEVSQKLGISIATVSVHLTIALRQVRAFLLSRLGLWLVLAVLPWQFCWKPF